MITLVIQMALTTSKKMHMVDDRLNLGRLSKMYLDEISRIDVLVNGNKIM